MKKIIFATVLLSIFLSSCGGDDATPEEDKGSLEVSIDGVVKDVSILYAVLTESDGSEGSSGHASHTLRLVGSVDGDSLTIRISNWDFQEPPDDAIHVKDYYDNFMESELEIGENDGTCMRVSSNGWICEGTIITFQHDEKSFGVFDHPENEALLRLTKCDGKKVSGTFDLTMQNYHNNEETLEIKAELKEVAYTVKNN